MTNLTKYRKLKHFTQSQLACMAGLSKSAIAQYEQKQRDINKASAETLFRLSQILSCKMEDLLENDNDALGRKTHE